MILLDHVGITATQHGATLDQLSTFRKLIRLFMVYHGGVCIGGDEQTAAIAKAEGLRVEGHPPIRKAKMSKVLDVYDFMYPPEEYLERNLAIVYASGSGIGLPQRTSEDLRSGTWYTIRRFRVWKKPLAIIWPDGSMTLERGMDIVLKNRGYVLHSG